MASSVRRLSSNRQSALFVKMVCIMTMLSVLVLPALQTPARASTGPAVQWQKTFGNTRHDSGESVQQTSDGGYIIAGFAGYETDMESNAYLIKTSSKGTLEWQREFGVSGGSQARSVQQTTDGGYIVAGFTNVAETDEGDAYLVKFNSSGTKAWEKVFGGSTEEWAESVFQTADGGYIFAGGVAQANTTTDAYLVKTDSEGNLEWENSFGGGGSEWAECARPTKDGGFILAGYTNSYEDLGNNGYLVKADSNGNLVWEKTFGGAGSDWFQFVDQTLDTGFIIAGGSENRAHLVKTDANGELSWQKTFKGDVGGWGFCARQARDGNYLLSGYLQATTGWNRGFLVKTDTVGNTIWSNAFGGLDGYSSGHEFQQTSDGGYIIAGFTNNSGSRGNDVYLVKMASDSNLPVITSIQPESGPVGTEVSISGSMFGDVQNDAYVSFGEHRVTSCNAWTDTLIRADVPSGTYGKIAVTVTTQSGSSNEAYFTVTGPPPPDPVISPVWYLAEGSSDWGFDTYVTMMNPNTSAVTAEVTYMTREGPRDRPEVVLPPLSQTVINPRNDLGASDFSTRIACKEGRSIAVDRRMIWTAPGTSYTEGHASIGVISPARTWYLPEGSSAWGFECWLLVQNPNSVAAECAITYQLEDAPAVTKTKNIQANSRATFNIRDDIGENDASIKIESQLPIIPERAMYRNSRREGHASIGTTSPESSYYLPEGTTAWGFTTYVLVQNPNDATAEVTLTYMTPTGGLPQAPFTMPPNSRETIRVNDYQPDTDLAVLVAGTKPLVAERAMYWNNGTGEACHDSIGIAAPHTSFFFPDGETTNGHETWTLVQNPNDTEVRVQISYYSPSGTGNKSILSMIPPRSRKTFNMADLVPSGRAAVAVVSKTGGAKILAERSMYWNERGAGTDSIGGCSD